MKKKDRKMRLRDLTIYAKEKHHIAEQSGFTIVLASDLPAAQAEYHASAIPFSKPASSLQPAQIPEKIRKMIKLYRYGDGSFRQKCRNFYVQAKFMEDYEDDAPWNGEFHRYFTVYHDLSVKQLRGYFTWRTKVRKGVYEPIAASLAYLYLYELLNGIGTSSLEDALCKMEAFENGFIDSGIGDGGMRKNLRRWMHELAVTGGAAPETAVRYANAETLKRDVALLVLRKPAQYSDDGLFGALCVFGGAKIQNGAVFKKSEAGAKRLFAAVWRYAASQYKKDGKDFFTACFGRQREFSWHPLENAVYWNPKPVINADYVLNECHRYICRGGKWKERCYHSLYYDKALFEGLLREAERRLRIYLNAGRPLKERPEDAWAAALIEDVIAAEKRLQAEALKPKVTIRFGDLDRIRKDALQTRESLLTEEEKADEKTDKNNRENQAHAEKAARENSACKNRTSDEPAFRDEAASGGEIPAMPITAEQADILMLLLRGESVKSVLKARNEMAEIFADSLNETLFDTIGDIAVECDNGDLTLVEDYREDIGRILGGNIQ
ncbi:TerB N-terminal domain-containing protein [Treponema putidum]|uniref:TerB N-terminal domain-containing protein n=1 Tax=Treponema putidum TaxID=221027 RepID=UPI000678F6CB|nr:TerB N-terminal domain-containing protein [Treponema putidum]